MIIFIRFKDTGVICKQMTENKSMFFSQCEEDKILYTKFFKHYTLPGQKYFFEMGAIDGLMYNNTKFYEDWLNWKGVLVEANPFAYSRCVLNRPNCISMNALVSDSTKPLTFRISTNIPAVCSVADTTPASFENEYYRHAQMVNVTMIPVPLSDVINKCGFPRIDLAILDVEGHEMHVLNSFNFEATKVPVVSWLIESFEEDNSELTSFMEQHKYKNFGKVAHNLFFIHHDYLQYFPSC